MSLETGGELYTKKTPERVITPEDLHIKGGDPLYYVLLKERDPIVISSAEAQEAHDLLRDLFAKDREAVLSCADMSFENAKVVLDGLRAKSVN